MKWISAILLLFVLQGCTSKNEPAQNFEQDVFDQVFHEIVDSTYRDKRLYTFHCPNGNPLIKDDLLVGFDNPECNKQFNLLRKDSLDLVLAVEDSASVMNLIDKPSISKEYQPLNSTSFQINLALHQTKKFNFRYLSELPEDIEFQNWHIKYAKFIGSLAFSRIYFDKEKKRGIISVGYSCGGKCGRGYLISISNHGQKWVVEKVIDTWIA